MPKSLFLKTFLPLIIACIGAFVFFLAYNQYILDKSLANLKISLKNLEKAKTLAEVKGIKDILREALLMEIAKTDFDPAVVLKLELATQMAEKITDEAQIKDIKHFVQDVVNKKTQKKSAFARGVENIALRLFPQQREVDFTRLKQIENTIKRQLSRYKGEELQEKLLEIAKLYIQFKDFDGALIYLSKALEVKPKGLLTPKIKFYLAIAYKFKGEFKQAALIFKEIQEQIPKEQKEFYAYQEADSLFRAGSTEEALHSFAKIFNTDPCSEIAQLAQFRNCYIYLYEAKKIETSSVASKNLIKDVVENEECTPEQKQSSIVTYIQDKITPDIAGYYRERAYKLLRLGYAKTDKQRYKAAIGTFNLALNIYKKDALSYSGKGLGFLFLDVFEQALAESKKAVHLSPRDAVVLANLGFVYYKLGVHNEALEAYKKAMLILPKSAFLRYNLGTLYLITGNLILAQMHLNEAIKLKPTFARSYNNLGYILWLRGEFKNAKLQFKRAITLKPRYVVAHYNLGVVLYQLGEYEEAGKEFLSVKELRPDYRKTNWYLEEIAKKLKE